jgi:sialic acid synthase SpsE
MTKFIAEVSSNHNGDFNRALALIDAAANAGCWGVKFQLFQLDKLWAKELLNAEKYAFVNQRREWELPPEWLPELAKYSHELGLEFGCTPFHLEAVDALEPHVDFFKIASYEALWWDLYECITKTGLPLIVSLGMANADEIDEVKSRLTHDYDYAEYASLLHCVSKYPVDLEDCNLSMIERIRGDYNKMPVGWSDHSADQAVVLRAVHFWQAAIVEFHLDLDDKAGVEYDGGHCWAASDAMDMIALVHAGFEADGVPTPETHDLGERHKRRDPDGLRPMMAYRQSL